MNITGKQNGGYCTIQCPDSSRYPGMNGF